jgi:hypothetical protein
MVEAFTTQTFVPYFFGNFACIMVDVTTDQSKFWTQEKPIEFWDKTVLGCFYVIPSHFKLIED